jgi:hypothetical protein
VVTNGPARRRLFAAPGMSVARSSGTTASSAGPASAGRQAHSGNRPTSCPDSADPAEEPALKPLLTQFPARFRAVADARLSART